MIPIRWSLRAAAMAAALGVAFAPGLARAQATLSARVLNASSLPRLASDLRDLGVPQAEVRTALEAMHSARVPADDAMQVLRSEYQARVEDRVPEQEFGSVVQESLDRGLRGRALAQAITAARAGKRNAAHPPKGKPRVRPRPDR